MTIVSLWRCVYKCMQFSIQKITIIFEKLQIFNILFIVLLYKKKHCSIFVRFLNIESQVKKKKKKKNLVKGRAINVKKGW